MGTVAVLQVSIKPAGPVPAAVCFTIEISFGVNQKFALKQHFLDFI